MKGGERICLVRAAKRAKAAVKENKIKTISVGMKKALHTLM